MFGLLCGYLFLFIERPWEVWQWMAPFHIERSYMILALILFALWRGKQIRWGLHASLVFLFLALHYLFAPLAFSPHDALDQGFEYFKTVVFFLLIIWSIKDVYWLQKLVQAYLGVTGIYMLHSFVEYTNGRHEYRMGITRMVGVDQYANNPNAFAATLVFTLPFVWLFLKLPTTRKALKILGVLYAGFVITCVILTGSRAGFVTMVFFFLMAWIWEKRKTKFLLLPLLVLFGIAAWHFIPQDKRARIETIWNPESGPANAEESAEGRIDGLKAGLRMLKAKPLTGVGAGGTNFISYRVARDDGTPSQAHNLAGQLLGSMGIIGGLVFLCQIVITWRMAGKLQKQGCRQDSFLPALGAACRQTLLLMLVSGLFGHNLYRPNWLWIGAWSFLGWRFSQDGLANSSQGRFPQGSESAAS